MLLSSLLPCSRTKAGTTVPRQVRKGIARALLKFDEYQLAKYDREGAIKLRDVFRLVHAKPPTKTGKVSKLWKRAVKGELETPDTWETALTSGADKKETFTRLLKEEKLGYLALLRNLRNMAQAGVDSELINDAIIGRQNGAHRVLPFRFTAAARICPQFERALDLSLLKTIEDLPKLSGKTSVLVDVSGSMDVKLSAKSDMTRMDAAATLASIIPGDLRVFTFSNSCVEVPARKGMAGVDAIVKSQMHGSTQLGAAIDAVNRQISHDRLIVITDEQTADKIPNPVAKLAYMINVASARNGVGYGKWTHIDGFSESVLRFIAEIEGGDFSDLMAA
jgi:60 kDa SS-A/Ro ribonucleoprotein